MNRLVQSWEDRRTEWEPMINELADKIVAKISDFSHLRNRYYTLRSTVHRD